jgi:hypothetical protein
MDLNRFLQVAWRFKLLLAGGLVLATVVAFLSLARVTLGGNSPSVQFREQETWLSASTLLVTQSGFPWGRAILDDVITVQPKGAEALTIPRYGDPGRYSGLAAIYAQLAKADPVRNSVMAGAGPGSRYEAEVVKSADGSGALPLLYIKGYGPSSSPRTAPAHCRCSTSRATAHRRKPRRTSPTRPRSSSSATSSASRPRAGSPPASACRWSSPSARVGPRSSRSGPSCGR